MARLGTDSSNLLETMDLEGKRPGFSYSIETLKELHRIFGSPTELYFIIGIDAFLEIRTWRDYKGLFDYAHFVVLFRAGCGNHPLNSSFFRPWHQASKTGAGNHFTAPSGNAIILITPTRMEISSTNIRNMVKEGKSIHFLVPETVRDYIVEKGLYLCDDPYRKSKLCLTTILERKAVDPILLHVEDLTTVADYFLITGGNSTRQVQAISRHLQTNA